MLRIVSHKSLLLGIFYKLTESSYSKSYIKIVPWVPTSEVAVT